MASFSVSPAASFRKPDVSRVDCGQSFSGQRDTVSSSSTPGLSPPGHGLALSNQVRRTACHLCALSAFTRRRTELSGTVLLTQNVIATRGLRQPTPASYFDLSNVTAASEPLGTAFQVDV